MIKVPMNINLDLEVKQYIQKNRVEVSAVINTYLHEKFFGKQKATDLKEEKRKLQAMLKIVELKIQKERGGK